MPDALISAPPKADPSQGEFIVFVVPPIRGLYRPAVGVFARWIPNTPAAIASAQLSVRASQAAWLN